MYINIRPDGSVLHTESINQEEFNNAELVFRITLSAEGTDTLLLTNVKRRHGLVINPFIIKTNPEYYQ